MVVIEEGMFCMWTLVNLSTMSLIVGSSIRFRYRGSMMTWWIRFKIGLIIEDRVAVEEYYSDWWSVVSDALHGSVLEPLFVIYTND